MRLLVRGVIGSLQDGGVVGSLQDGFVYWIGGVFAPGYPSTPSFFSTRSSLLLSYAFFCPFLDNADSKPVGIVNPGACSDKYQATCHGLESHRDFQH